ncbi:hypothetical protein E1180_09115 [Roseibium denhamense]|uniref:Uncharacterized protein n=1 Tax=Roseibium denhamense TaxID=76305 RepID=A0ABY1N9I8_9HYPH|nr:hypothetical protein [Roseibium denhamense]MTI05676.1 hypothetical protein [Roseibium denhamense]SMP04119.1 hypothetical protein SAMN06265374_0586 [Roseibium denhamense]
MARNPKPAGQKAGTEAQGGEDPEEVSLSSKATQESSGAKAAGTATKDETARGRADQRSGRVAPDTAAVFKHLLESYLETSRLQGDYQNLYRSLPAVVGIAAEVLKKKEDGDAALNEGMQAVERVLKNARDKAEQLSKAMLAQQAALDQILQNKTSLTELLKAGGQAVENQKPAKSLATDIAALSDPKVAYQLNTLMGTINAMISREIARQLSGYNGATATAQKGPQTASAAPPNTSPKT